VSNAHTDNLIADKLEQRAAPGRKDAYLASLAKALQVLEAFDIHQPALTMAAIAEIVGLDRAGARRALLTLKHMGYVETDGKLFRLTPRVLSLGYRYLGGLFFWRSAQAVMEQLADELNETVSIGVLDAADVIFVWRVPGRRLLTFDPRIGTRVPAYVSSIGYVMLAALRDEELADYMSALKLERLTQHTVRTKAEFMAHLKAVRSQGWSFVARQQEENFFGLAVPISEPNGRVVAALHVGGLYDAQAERRAKEEMLPRLRVAALKLSGKD